MIVEMNDSLTESAARQVLLSAVSRYARIATLDVDPWWSTASGGILGSTLMTLAQSPPPDESRRVAEVLSRVGEALDLVDETPTGPRYYPYNALTQVEMAAKALLANGRAPALNGLWEYALRFATHVDWQVRKSRIFMSAGQSFTVREETLWLRNARLTGEVDTDYEAYVRTSVGLADAYMEAVVAALSENSSADHVVTTEAAGLALDEAGVWRPHGRPEVRWRVGGPSIYVGDASPVGSVNLRSIQFVYLWSDSPRSVAAFIAAHVPGPAWVDCRAEDGRVFERAAFLEDPQPTTPAW